MAVQTENINLKLEQEVLGALIQKPVLLDELVSSLSENLFTNTEHIHIYTIIKDYWNEYKCMDLSILGIELQKRNLVHLVPYTVDLAMSIASTAHTEHHIFLLTQLSVKRDFILKFKHLLNIANSDTDIFEIRDKAYQYFDDLFIDKFIERNKKQETFSDLIEKVQQKFERIHAGQVPGIPSSLNIINKAFGGWQNSDLTVVAGRPGMGKTAFIVQQAVDAALQNLAVGIFSLEMSAEQIASRILTNITQIPNSSVLRKGLKPHEIQVYLDHKPNLQELPIHIDDIPAITIDNLKTKAKMMKLRHNIQILFVDYLQLINHNSAKSREQEISTISRELKALAKELNIPVIALSQLSRNVEQRHDKRPLLSDLRDSGAIEQDADEVIFLYRPEYYGISQWGEEYGGEPTDNEIEIIIQKNRHGGILSERCEVNLAISKFNNINYTSYGYN